MSAAPQDYRMGGEIELTTLSSNIYTLSFIPESVKGPNDDPEMISSQELTAILAAMMLKLMESLQLLTKKNSEDMNNQAKNGFAMAQGSNNEVVKMKADLDAYVYARDHRSWFEKAMAWLSETKIFGVSIGTILVTAISVAVTALTMGGAAALVALAIGVMSAMGAFDPNSEGPLSGMAKAIEDTGPVAKIFIKIVIVAVLAWAGGSASTYGVAGGATQSFVQRSMTVLLAMQMAASTGVTYDICKFAADKFDPNGNEETKKKWAMFSSIVLNLVAMIASMKFTMGSMEGVDLKFLSANAQKAQGAQQLFTILWSFATSLNQIYQAQTLNEQSDLTASFAERQKNMAIFTGMGDLNSASVKAVQEELKSTLDEYAKLFADSANYNVNGDLTARVIAS